MANQPKKTAAARRAVPRAKPDERSIFELGADDLEKALRGSASRAARPGSDEALLRRDLPADQLAQLRQLAERAEVPEEEVRATRKVLVLPGLMGSQIEIQEGKGKDLIWINLLRMVRGQLGRIAMPDKEDIRAGDAIGVIYAPLKLYLQIKGFKASYHPFDWRRDIRDLGAELAERIKASDLPVDLVAHSMGGMVARMALADPQAAKKVGQLITLGTPHAGSFAVTQAYDGTSSTAKQIDTIDRKRNLAELCEIFTQFPGLAMLMPDPAVLRCPDFAVPSNWPAAIPHPNDDVLAMATALRTALPGKVPGVDMTAIVGVGQKTAIGASANPALGRIDYAWGDGDGTVPLRSAAWPLADRTYFVEAEHGKMPWNGDIQSAVEALLKHRAPKLPDAPPAPRGLSEPVRQAPETLPQSDAEALELALRPFLAKPDADDTVLPPQQPDEAEEPATVHTPLFDQTARGRYVAGAGCELRLEIRLRRGNLLDCPADCYALGLFSGVDPAGAASAVDDEMEGAVARMVAHRMLASSLGEISVLPNGRHLLRARAVAFVGLGALPSFLPQSMEAVGTSLMRTMIATRMDEVAMVPFGTSAAHWTKDSFGYFIQGLVTALKEEPANRFRALTICDRDAGRVTEIRQWLQTICTSKLIESIELVIDEGELAARQPTRTGVKRDDRAYLFLTQKPADEESAEIDEERKTHAALLQPHGATAAISWLPQAGSPDQVDALLDDLGAASRTIAGVAEFGTRLGELALAHAVAQQIAALGDTHLSLVHGEFDSRLPWETLTLGGKGPALTGGISHRYLSPDRSIAKWNNVRNPGDPVRIFSIGNPTGDLPGADKEVTALEALVDGHPQLRIVGKLYREAATLDAVTSALNANEIDVLHYSGHAFFDPDTHANGGLILAGGDVLTGRRIMALGRLPSVVFLNACEAARVRGLPLNKVLPARDAVEEQGSLAEVLLKSGVGNFIGTYWPVGDDAAMGFSREFYARIAGGDCLNKAVLAGRNFLYDNSLPDWANYVFYGDPEFSFS